MYVQEKLNQRIKFRNYDSLMPFPALSAILSVCGYTGLAALVVESLGGLTPTRASSKQPSDLPHFVCLAINLQLLWLLWMLTVTQVMVWCCFRQSTLSLFPQLQLQEDIILHCALCDHYHHPNHLSWHQVPGFWQEIHTTLD